MAVKVKFPIFVFTDYGYTTCLGKRDLCIQSKKSVESGFFKNLEFIDSDGILRLVKKVEQTKSIPVSVVMNIVRLRKMIAVEITEVAENPNLSLEEMTNKIIKAVCYVAEGAEKQFDPDELHYVLSRKKSIKDVIEYFSGPLPEFLDAYQVV